MKLIFVIILASLAHLTLLGKQPDVVAYNRLINTAEISICNDNLKEALRNFRLAYEILGDAMPSRQLRNYFMVSAYLDQPDDETKILTELKRREPYIQWFDYIVKTYFPQQSTQLKQLFYERLTNINPSVDSVYYKVLDSLLSVDQKTNRYLRSLNSGIFMTSTSDSFHKLTDMNMHCLKTLFERKFPSDYKVGSLPDYQVILIHNAQGYQSRILDSCLFIAMQSGNLDVIEFEEYLENYQRSTRNFKSVFVGGIAKDVNVFPFDFIVLNDSLFEFKVADSTVEKCNKNRKAFPGFCSVEDLRTKIIYEYDHPQYTFTLRDYPFDVTESAPELPASFRKRLRYIKTKNKK